MMLLVVAGALVLIAIAMLRATFFTVGQRSVVVVQRLGPILPHSPGYLASVSEPMRTARIGPDQTVRSPGALGPVAPGRTRRSADPSPGSGD